jgi:predicted anti-sigma-YlaC factor YlaD
MTCNTMREQILEADLAELRGETDTPLAQHLRKCHACRGVAEKIVLAEADLGVALDAMSTGVRTRRTTAPRRRLGHWAVLVPLAAAAGLAAIMLGRGADVPTEPALTALQVGALPVVEPADDQTVAIFTTDDPDIVVVWFLGGTD